jgi:beta-mannosidase
MRRIAIEGWTVRPIGDAVECPSRVRDGTFELGAGGYVHDALVVAGVIPPIDAPGGEDAQHWVGRTDWCLSAWFRLREADLACGRVDLAFDWIDTLGDVLVNGVRVTATANEFVPVRVSARAFLVAGVNAIDVRLRGPVTAVEALERRYGPRPVNGDWTPFPFLRKCASNFGWDWGPKAASVGLGGARVECYDGGRIAEVRPLVVRCDEDTATVEVHVACEHVADGEVRATLTAPDGSCVERTAPIGDDGTACLPLDVPRPERWWPRGMGGQPLYRLHVAADGCSRPEERRIGLRRVALRTEPDAHGSRFAIEVNGAEVWCRGANWVPRTPLPRGTTAAADRLERLAADANLNMLRVWGGGIYETDAFYGRCDELGILVWQDFMFACATYPEHAPYAELVEREARHQVARLSSHPSIVLWCGGNEDILAWWSWGWKERLRPGQSWGKGFWLDLLPRVTAELDPTRPYWAESPYSGSMEIHPNDPDHGDRHTWDAKIEAYRTIVPRFCSEFGHQSPPTISSLHDLIPPDGRAVGNAELATRQRAWGGDAFQYAPFLAERFREPRSLDEWAFAAQLLQARAYEIAILWMRANAPRCMGSLFWQLNDVWTGHSWSVLDANARPKPSYFAVARACAAEAIAILPADVAAPMVPGSVAIVRAATEKGLRRERRVRARLVDAGGQTLADRWIELSGESPWVARAALPAELVSPRDRASSVLVVDMPDGDVTRRATWTYVHDRDFAFAPPALVARRLDASHVALSSRGLSRDVCIDERCEPSLGFVTLLPGETLRVACRRDVAEGEIVVRSAASVGG